MARPFNRELQTELFEALKQGPLQVILQAARDNEADIRFRGKEVHVYSRGNRVAALILDRRKQPRLQLHTKYCQGTPLGSIAGSHTVGHERQFVIDELFATQWASALATVREKAAKAKRGPEGEIEGKIVRANQSGTPIEIIDRQVQMPGLPSRDRLDLLGVSRHPATNGSFFVAIELKRGSDVRVQRLPEQVRRYMAMLAPRGLVQQAIISSYRNVASQRQALGLPSPNPACFDGDMSVVALVVIADHNPRSQLIPRARRNAVSSEYPIAWTTVGPPTYRLGGIESWEWLTESRPPFRG